MPSRRSSRQGALPTDLASLIEDYNDLEERVRRLETPSGETIGNTMPKTEASIAELEARATYAAESTYAVTAPVGTTLPYDTGLHAPINFTLTERRRVHFLMSLYVSSSVAHDGSGPFQDAFVRVLMGIVLVNNTDGTTDTARTSPLGYGEGYNAGQRAVVRFSLRAAYDDYSILEPGDYTVSVSAVLTNIDATAGAVLIQYPKLAVEVMEKA